MIPTSVSPISFVPVCSANWTEHTHSHTHIFTTPPTLTANSIPRNVIGCGKNLSSSVLCCSLFLSQQTFNGHSTLQTESGNSWLENFFFTKINLRVRLQRVEAILWEFGNNSTDTTQSSFLDTERTWSAVGVKQDAFRVTKELMEIRLLNTIT
jgi:hypothetical protein